MSAILENFGDFREGFASTVMLMAISGVLAFVLGTFLLVMRLSPVPTLRWFAAAYVEILRNVPSTILFFFAAFVLPQFGLRLPYFWFAIMALTAYYTAFYSEALRSGVNSVDSGQIEASLAIGLTVFQSLRYVVLPQAFRNAIPPIINVTIALVKTTSVASAFGVSELIAAMNNVAAAEAQATIPILVGVMFAYLVITIPSGMYAHWLEKHYGFSR